MQCPDCWGRGYVDRVAHWDWFHSVWKQTCQSCQGSGTAYCCEGEQAQPECATKEEEQ